MGPNTHWTPLQVSDIVGLEWHTTQSLHQGENEYRPALVLHVLPPSAPAPAPGEAAAACSSATRQPASTPAASGRSRSRLGTDTAERAAAAGRSLSPTKTPVSARPSPSAAGLAGGIRRCAIMLSARHAHEEEGSGSECGDGEGSQAGSAGDSAGGSAGSEEDEEESVSEEEEEQQQHASRASGTSSLPPLAAPLGSALLQREWQLLGELEYVLRLCILESREQVEHQDVTVREARLGGLWATAGRLLPGAATCGSPASHTQHLPSCLRCPAFSRALRTSASKWCFKPPLSSAKQSQQRRRTPASIRWRLPRRPAARCSGAAARPPG